MMKLQCDDGQCCVSDEMELVCCLSVVGSSTRLVRCIEKLQQWQKLWGNMCHVVDIGNTPTSRLKVT